MVVKRFFRSLLLGTALVFTVFPLFATDHQWGTYHWSKGSGDLTLTLGDNVDSKWDAYLKEAEADWEQSTVLSLSVVPGATTPKRCKAANGKIEVCNSTYGRTGWLGVAGISVSGGHIVSGYTKVNDTYFNTATYNTPAWRRMVMCQEIGHDFGIDHQDENFDNPNLGSCMDYTSDPDGPPSNEHPNADDYNLLESMYAHTHASALSVVAAAAERPATVGEILAGADQWGTPIRFDPQGRPTVFVMPVGVNHSGEIDFDLTHVLWAPVDPFTDMPERERIDFE